MGTYTVTKSPTSATTVPGLFFSPGTPWRNLQNILQSDGAIAESGGMGSGSISVFATLNGVLGPIRQLFNGDTNVSQVFSTLNAYIPPLKYTSPSQVYYTPEDINSPTFGIVIYPPYTEGIVLTGFNFNIPSGKSIKNIDVYAVHRQYSNIPYCLNNYPADGQFCVVKQFDYVYAVVTYTDCAQSWTGCVGTHMYRCDSNYDIVDGGIASGCGAVCDTGWTKCDGGHKYVCNDGYWLDQGVDHTCPGVECSSGQTECVNGNRFNCENGWWVVTGEPNDCCIPGATKCLNGHRYDCDENQSWIDQGERPDPKAPERVFNGNFSTGNTSGWLVNNLGGSHGVIYSNQQAYVFPVGDLNYAVGIGIFVDGGPCSISQNIDLTNVNNLTFWSEMPPYGIIRCRVYIDGVVIWERNGGIGDWNGERANINLNHYVGLHTIKFEASSVSYSVWDLTNISAIGIVQEECTGIECSGSGTSCTDGYRYQCDNGWLESLGSSDCCSTGMTKCINGHLYMCDGNQNWTDNGLSHTCPGSECLSGQTECINGNRYDCNNGWWADQGPDTICPGTGCTGDVTRCVGDHRFTCENGYDVDKGVDKTCPGSECTGTDTHCDGEHLIACENGWVVDKGVDATCQDVPKNNDLLIYGALGTAAICGLLLLLGGASEDKKKRRKN
jgi:hypothetical protein